jgi:hypothetical protein
MCQQQDRPGPIKQSKEPPREAEAWRHNSAARLRLHAEVARGVGAMKTQYSIEFIESRDGLVGENVLARESDLDTAHTLYKFCARQFPDRVVLLADRARVLARSDYP